MAIRIRKKDNENLSDTQLEKVANLLAADSPITKKRACTLLNISYNTTRLNNIIKNYADKREYSIQRRKKLKNTPLSNDEISYIISSYLEELSLTDIANATFRSLGIVKRTLEKYKIPLRNSKNSYFNPVFLDEDSIAEDYKTGDLVYSARYNEPAKISKLYKKESFYSIYSIWLCHTQQSAYQPSYELADLRELQKKFKIDIPDMKWEEDILPVINKTLQDAKRRKTKNE